MNTNWKFILPLGKLILLGVLPTLALIGVQFLADAPIDWNIFLQLGLFCSVVLLIAGVCQPKIDARETLKFNRWAILLIVFMISLGFSYWLSHSTFLGWLLLGSLFALLLGWVTILGSGLALWKKLFVEGFFLALAGFLPPLLNQIETRFSTEEFFVIIEVAILMAFWLILRIAFLLWMRGKPKNSSPAKWQIRRGWFMLLIGLLSFGGIIFTVIEYQSSFFPPEAPGFPGISNESPFICGKAPSSKDIYPGTEVFQDILEQVERNPNKNAPEFAFLALGTQDQKWANKFRENILSEAEVGLFTEPVGSVKYGQYLATHRAYFYPQVRDAFPGLFTAAEEEIILDWFSAINQRTFTVEWVDLMYALAFRYWPQGPYENQENGAGLISLLEINELADPNLSYKNQQYLADNPRGWQMGFRVTDDAAMYQPEWVGNAWYQSIYTDRLNPKNQELSFDWLKILALPDGSPLRYNHLGAVIYSDRAYWGANLLNDESLLWLAGRALDYQIKHLIPSSGQPGAEVSLNLTGNSPTIGSCLGYGNSGLPTQQGPLAPDKIVFRSGWEIDDIYLLLNLRFTGWHRYKATNALMQVYKGEPLVIEDTLSENFEWLPTGRSIFRDKRIPRENLNSLQIAKTGLAAVLYQLTSIGGPWAQDPPFYAKVTHFETTPEFDSSTTRIDGWHGWQHQRTIYFYHEGIIVIFDSAEGPRDHPAALTWHLVSELPPDGDRILLGSAEKNAYPAEVVPITFSISDTKYQSSITADHLPILQMEYQASESGNIRTATIFLFDDWVGADIQTKNQTIKINSTERQITIPLPKWSSTMPAGKKPTP